MNTYLMVFVIKKGNIIRYIPVNGYWETETANIKMGFPVHGYTGDKMDNITRLDSVNGKIVAEIANINGAIPANGQRETKKTKYNRRFSGYFF